MSDEDFAGWGWDSKTPNLGFDWGTMVTDWMSAGLRPPIVAVTPDGTAYSVDWLNGLKVEKVGTTTVLLEMNDD